MQTQLDYITENTAETAVFTSTMRLTSTVKLSTGRPIVNHPHYEVGYVPHASQHVGVSCHDWSAHCALCIVFSLSFRVVVDGHGLIVGVYFVCGLRCVRVSQWVIIIIIMELQHKVTFLSWLSLVLCRSPATQTTISVFLNAFHAPRHPHVQHKRMRDRTFDLYQILSRKSDEQVRNASSCGSVRQ